MQFRLFEKREGWMISGVVILLTGFYLVVSWLQQEPPALYDGLPSGRLEPDDDGLDVVLGSQIVPEEDGFTMVAPTYKRLATISHFISHYASGDIPSLRRIVIIWTDVDDTPSATLLESLRGHHVPVVIVQPNVNSLNQRFHHDGHVKTDCVLSMDNDMIYAPDDIEFGYQTWREFGRGRRRMLGYIAREASSSRQYLHSKLKSYSMVLTKSAFYHVDWMQAYWSNDTVMSALRDYVDQHMNCEDLLMSFLQAHYTRLSPLLVKVVKPLDLGRSDGVSSAKGHIAARNACIRHFSDIFGADTLVSSSLVMSRMGSLSLEPIQ